MMNLSRLAYLARYYAEARFLHIKKPILAGIKLTHRCTLRCRQCPYWQRPVPDLKWEQVKETLRNLYLEGVRILILEGGEPFLWQDDGHKLNDIVKEAKKYFYCVGITTNGTLPLETDADNIWVSVDGLKETHDRLRGRSFDKIVQHIRQSSHPRIFANITINKLNYLELPDLVRYLTPLVKGITIQFFYPYSESEDLLLTWEERAKALDDLIALKKEGYPLSDSVLALEKLKNNAWVCEPWMLANVEPDGTIHKGCYLNKRTDDQDPCHYCGFAAHTEISLAYQLHPGAILAGRQILKIF